MRNLEFKAALADPREAMARARALGAELWGDLRQTDTYFDVRRGRLKLRETAGFQDELIFYERDEQAGGRPAQYSLVAFRQAPDLLPSLERALGVVAVVRKRRTLLLLDTSRIHLDNVDGLGSFLEIEVPVAGDEGAARERLDGLISGLGYAWADCIRRSYADMVREQRS